MMSVFMIFSIKFWRQNSFVPNSIVCVYKGSFKNSKGLFPFNFLFLNCVAVVLFQIVPKE